MPVPAGPPVCTFTLNDVDTYSGTPDVSMSALNATGVARSVSVAAFLAERSVSTPRSGPTAAGRIPATNNPA